MLLVSELVEMLFELALAGSFAVVGLFGLGFVVELIRLILCCLDCLR